MSKGCGCQTGLFKFLKPPYAKRFQAACELHDNDYDRGGTEGMRRSADRLLYWHIQETVTKEYTTPWTHLWFTLIAMLYYVSVRIFGRFYFKYD